MTLDETASGFVTSIALILIQQLSLYTQQLFLNRNLSYIHPW